MIESAANENVVMAAMKNLFCDAFIYFSSSFYRVIQIGIAKLLRG